VTAGRPPRRRADRRPPNTAPGSRRPREARRPERPAASTPRGTGAIGLLRPTVVELTPEHEHQAIGALAELLVPVLQELLGSDISGGMPVDVAPVVDT